MLLWANYRTSKRSTPKSVDDDDSKSEMESCSESKSGASDAVQVCALPTSLDKRQNLLDDDNSTLGSSSRHQAEQSVGSYRSDSNSRASKGKIGKLFSNLQDMIDPPYSESDDYSEGGSDDESTDSRQVDEEKKGEHDQHDNGGLIPALIGGVALVGAVAGSIAVHNAVNNNNEDDERRKGSSDS